MGFCGNYLESKQLNAATLCELAAWHLKTILTDLLSEFRTNKCEKYGHKRINCNQLYYLLFHRRLYEPDNEEWTG